MMNIDEAIAQAERIAEGQEKSAELSPFNHAKERISKSAADHRQLAKWLTELKEAKRLLKAAVEDMRWVNENTQDADGSCIMRNCEGCGDCPLDINGDLWCKWKHEADALKLIGGEDNG